MERLFGTDGIRVVANGHPASARMSGSPGRAVVKALGRKMAACTLIGGDARESGGMPGDGLLAEHRETDTAHRRIAKSRETTTEEIG